MPHSDPGEIQNRQNASYDEDRVSGKPEPFEEGIRTIRQKAQRARVKVSRAHRVIELKDAERKECRKDHPGKPDVQAPKTDFGRAVAPKPFRNDIAQAEQRQGY